MKFMDDSLNCNQRVGTLQTVPHNACFGGLCFAVMAAKCMLRE